MRLAIKNVCVKTVSVFVLLFGFNFSLNASGMIGDAINCEKASLKRYKMWRKIVDKDPSNVIKIYNLGIFTLCLGNKIEEGMGYIERASSSDHIAATLVAALYYKTDGTFNRSRLTEDPQKFSDMITYYEEAAKQIESARNYPEGVTKDMPNLEKHYQISAEIFVSLPDSYYRGYDRALDDIVMGEAEYVDTKTVLTNMQKAAERCLKRPSLSVWNGKREVITKALRVRCQAMKDFADDALELERTRIAIAQDCSVPLRECSEHQDVVSQVASLEDTMWSKLDSVPPNH